MLSLKNIKQTLKIKKKTGYHNPQVSLIFFKCQVRFLAHSGAYTYFVLIMSRVNKEVV